MLAISIKDIVQREDLSVQNNASLRELIDVMQKNGRGLVVILRDRTPAGILTERDVVQILSKGIDLDEMAYPYSAKSLIIIREDRTIGHALAVMMENNIRRVIVTDKGGAFVGALTQHDLLRHLEEDFYRSFVKVKHILDKQRPLISVCEDDSVRKTLDLMVKNNISSVPVLRDGKAVGIITEKDILGVAAQNIDLDQPANRYMSSPVIGIVQETALNEVVRIMNEQNIKRVIIHDLEGIAEGVVTIRDVLRNLEGDYTHFLERKLKHTKDVLNLFPEALIELADMGGEYLVIWANERALRTFGEKILDSPVTDFIPSDRWSSMHETLLADGKTEDVKFKKDNNIYELSGFYVDTGGQIEQARVQLIIRDITEEVKLATLDTLTNIYNRRFLNDYALKEICRSKRTKRNFMTVILDVDDFKIINDNYGHLSGDIILKHLAGFLVKSLRASDVIGRYGGEEFLIIMPETSKDSSFLVVDRLRSAIAAEEIQVLHGERVRISVSIGGASFPEDGTSSEDLLVRADERLYTAKREGKNRVVFN
jgi:diguanylate cyclase (GGDEF)-like protein